MGCSVSKLKGADQLLLINNNICDCTICYSEETISRNHKLGKLYPSCKHHYYFGDQCLRKYVSSKIQDSAIINCPSPGCTHQLNKSLVKKLVSPVEYERYRAYIKSSKRSIFKSIKVYMQDKYTDTEACLKMSSLGNKRCPKCKIWIEKNGGCNHMTCKKCGYDFYWCCGQEYGKGKRHSESVCQLGYCVSALQFYSNVTAGLQTNHGMIQHYSTVNNTQRINDNTTAVHNTQRMNNNVNNQQLQDWPLFGRSNKRRSDNRALYLVTLCIVSSTLFIYSLFLKNSIRFNSVGSAIQGTARRATYTFETAPINWKDGTSGTNGQSVSFSIPNIVSVNPSATPYVNDTITTSNSKQNHAITFGYQYIQEQGFFVKIIGSDGLRISSNLTVDGDSLFYGNISHNFYFPKSTLGSTATITDDSIINKRVMDTIYQKITDMTSYVKTSNTNTSVGNATGSVVTDGYNIDIGTLGVFNRINIGNPASFVNTSTSVQMNNFVNQLGF